MTTEQAGNRLDDIAALLAPTLHDLGFDLVQVSLVGGQRRTLQVMAEPLDKKSFMTVDDCAEISHAVSAVLDVADPIDGAYALEVSSPGIDRPLVRPNDFTRFAGYEIKAELEAPHEGRKRLVGKLIGLAEDGSVAIDIDGAQWRIPFARIKKAKLVLTDALIVAALKGEPDALEVRE